ncbi:MAG: relaxase MobL [bacterium]|nr:relaxase MobL [bacterium]
MSKSPNVVAMVHYYEKSSPKRGFYSSQETRGDYLGYVDSGHRAGEYEDYMDYSGNREKSSGVFSSNGLLTEKEKKEVRQMLQHTDSIIWDVVISTEENYGKEKLTSYESALKVIKEELPKLLKDNRMDISNVVWFAGLHENTDNRHIHLCFFEKEKQKVDPDTHERKFHPGMLSKLSLEDFKLRIEQNLNGHAYDLYRYRDTLLEMEKRKLEESDPKAIYLKDLKGMLLELYRKAPKGKYGYASHKADGIRPLLDSLTTYMLTSDESSMREFLLLMKRLKEKDEETKSICRRDKIDPGPHLLEKRFKDDLYRRCGNEILNYIQTAQGMEFAFLKGTENQKERWAEKKRRSFLYSRALRLSSEVERSRISSFEEFQSLLEKAEYERLAEEGKIKT